MQEILPGVFALPQNGGKGFGYVHFVQRPGGNLLLDSGWITDHFGQIAAMGGVVAVVLSDRHLCGDDSNKTAEYFGARVFAARSRPRRLGIAATRCTSITFCRSSA